MANVELGPATMICRLDDEGATLVLGGAEPIAGKEAEEVTTGTDPEIAAEPMEGLVVAGIE